MGEKNKYDELNKKYEQLINDNKNSIKEKDMLNQKISELEEENKQYQILKNDFNNLNNEKKFIQKELEKFKDKNKIIEEKNNIEFEKKKFEQLYNDFLNKFIDEKNKNENLKKMYENQKKLFNKSFPFEILNEEEKILNINFITFDENIYYSIIYKNTDKINNIINMFYDKYPEYKEFKNIFRFNGNEIKANETVEENHLNNNDNIIIESYSKEE